MKVIKNIPALLANIPCHLPPSHLLHSILQFLHSHIQSIPKIVNTELKMTFDETLAVLIPWNSIKNNVYILPLVSTDFSVGCTLVLQRNHLDTCYIAFDQMEYILPLRHFLLHSHVDLLDVSKRVLFVGHHAIPLLLLVSCLIFVTEAMLAKQLIYIYIIKKRNRLLLNRLILLFTHLYWHMDSHQAISFLSLLNLGGNRLDSSHECRFVARTVPVSWGNIGSRQGS